MNPVIRRVLVLSSIAPTPPNRGDRQRLAAICRMLSQHAEVTLFCLIRPWEPGVRSSEHQEREEIGRVVGPGVHVETAVVGRAEVAFNTVRAFAHHQPYIVGRYAGSRLRRIVSEFVRAHQPDLVWGNLDLLGWLPSIEGRRVVIDLVDSPTSPQAAQALRSSVLQRALSVGLNRAERHALEIAERVFVCTSENLAHLRRGYGSVASSVEVLPNTVDDQLIGAPWEPSFDGAGSLLFFGHLGYRPNVDAVRFLITELMPALRGSNTLTICGTGGGRAIADLPKRPDVRFTGFVPDLRPILRRSHVFVNAVPYASGSQTKMLGALAAGVPVVATKAATEASEIPAGAGVIPVQTLSEWKEAISQITADPDYARALSEQARAYASGLTWQRAAERLKGLFESPESVS